MQAKKSSKSQLDSVGRELLALSTNVNVSWWYAMLGLPSFGLYDLDFSEELIPCGIF